MNNRLRFVPPKQRLATTSGVWRKASNSPLGAWTRTPSVSTPPQPHPHQTLPSVSQRIPSVNPGLKSGFTDRSEEHTSELQSQSNLVCRLLLEKKKDFIPCCPPDCCVSRGPPTEPLDRTPLSRRRGRPACICLRRHEDILLALCPRAVSHARMI